MAEARDVRPHGNAHFLVEIGRTSARTPEAGFCEVVFPRFVAASAGQRPASDASASEPAGAPRDDCLVLRRGATGALDLYEWWQAARSGAKRGRVVTVKLLADDQATVVMTWRFRNARPVALSYSPLNALDGSVLMETIELAFETVEIASRAPGRTAGNASRALQLRVEDRRELLDELFLQRPRLPFGKPDPPRAREVGLEHLDLLARELRS